MAVVLDLEITVVEESIDLSITEDKETDLEMGEVQVVETGDHRKLENRDAADQHPISAITGLQEALDKAGTSFEVGHGLKMENENTLCVNTVSDFDGDNTLPITAAAVQETVGNIEILLSTI